MYDMVAANLDALPAFIANALPLIVEHGPKIAS